jgi:hypothetical protein
MCRRQRRGDAESVNRMSAQHVEDDLCGIACGLAVRCPCPRLTILAGGGYSLIQPLSAGSRPCPRRPARVSRAGPAGVSGPPAPHDTA